jgi:hypothetical protein
VPPFWCHEDTVEPLGGTALKGIDLGLFYILTQAYVAEDMQPRVRAVESSLKALGIEKTYLCLVDI